MHTKSSSSSSLPYIALAISPPPIANADELDISAPTLDALHTTSFNPSTEILTLTHIEAFEISAAFYNGFYTRTRYAYTAAYREISEFEKVEGMQRRDVSETAEPQKARLRCVSEGRPRARTSVAVSERAQQNDCWC
jgi:hypothetical protein